MHDGERERGVGAGADREVLVGKRGGARSVGVDDDEPGPTSAGFFNEWPQVNVVAVNVGAPRDDEAGMREVLWRGAELDAVDAQQRFATGAGADSAVELRGSEAVEEPAIHRPVAKLSDGACVAVGEDGFGAVRG